MATAPPSTDGKPPNQRQTKRVPKANTSQQVSFKNSNPAATNLKNGDAITVANNRLGAPFNSQLSSGPKLVIPNQGDCSSSPDVHPYQNLADSTVGIITNDQLRNADNKELAGNGIPAGQFGRAEYQNASNRDDKSLKLSSLYGYQSTASILKLLISGIHSEPIRPQTLIGNLLPSLKEQVSKVSTQSNNTIDHLDQLTGPAMHQLAEHGVLVNQVPQHQCQSTPIAQDIDSQPSNPISQEPNSSNIQKRTL